VIQSAQTLSEQVEDLQSLLAQFEIQAGGATPGAAGAGGGARPASADGGIETYPDDAASED